MNLEFAFSFQIGNRHGIVYGIPALLISCYYKLVGNQFTSFYNCAGFQLHADSVAAEDT